MLDSPAPSSLLSSSAPSGPAGLTDPSPGPVAVDPSPRRCSRCRGVFPGAEERNAAGNVVWWLCEPCHERLLGTGAS